MADEHVAPTTVVEVPEELRPDPPPTATPAAPARRPLTLRPTTRVRTRPGARRVYGDRFTQEVVVGYDEEGQSVTEEYYPHAGEWMSFVGSLTMDMYMSTLRLQKLRGRERRLRNLTRDATALEGSGEKLTDEEQASLDAAHDELATIADEVATAVRITNESLASLIDEVAWTDAHGNPIGEPTGRMDEDGQPICRVTADHLGSLSMEEVGWISDAALGDSSGTETEGN